MQKQSKPKRMIICKIKEGLIIMSERNIRTDFHLLCIGVSFIVLIMATGLPAYPKILATFDLSTGYAVWIQLGFALGLTGFQPLLGWLSDVYSQKAVVLFGAALMAVGSTLTAITPFFWLLIVGMFAKGVAGAAIVPAGFAYVGKFFEEEQRGKALSTFGVYSAVGAAIGPFLSGALVDTMGWEANFWFCALLSLLSLFIFIFGVPNIQGTKEKSFDVMGVGLMFLIMASLLTIPTFINNYGLSSGIWLPSVIVFALAFLLLIIAEKKQEKPMFDMEYAAARTFWVPAVIVVFLFLTYSGVMYLMTFFLQDVQGKSSTAVGLLQLIIFTATALGTYVSGKLIVKFSARLMLGLSIAFVLIGAGMLALATMETSYLYLSISMIFIGSGIGLAGPTTRAIVLSNVQPSRVGVITFTFNSIENVVQRTGASFAIMIFALFAAGGGGVQALAKTAIFFSVCCIAASLFILFIPKKVTGFKEKKTTTMLEKAE